jgi:putative nucleotidyltransferase with HDIG domain
VLEIKIEHSVRVAVDAAELARQLRWTAGDVRAARALGLLHDVGRFEQFARFRTLVDQKSVDHGEKGYEVVLKEGILKTCSARDRNAILAGIRYHNRRLVPDGLPSSTLRFVKLIRDADKIDIIHVLNDEIRRNRHREYPEIMLNVDLDGPPTKALVKQLLRQRTGSYENIRTLADMNLIRMSWVYDINYLPSLRQILERRLLQDLLDTIPSAPTAEVRRIMNNAKKYIGEKMAAGKMSLR